MKKKSELKIIPIGGLEQIGMNMTVFEYENEIIVVDCGIAFPSEDMMGIEKIIPDVSYLKRNASKIKGMFITHGHEDHIGAIPYIIEELKIPIYGTKLTIELIKDKISRAVFKDKLRKEDITGVRTHIVKFGDIISFKHFQIEFIKTNHSIQDAAALAIKTPQGTVVHTGDFKIDYTPVYGDRINLNRFAELGSEGVLAVLSDSTNAAKSGITMSESTVGETFDTIFAKHFKNRIIIGTYASNVDRVQQIINTASRYHRKVIIDGRSMQNTISIASKIGYVKIPENTVIDISEIDQYPDNEMVIVATGSQGEPMASLSRMSSNIHKYIAIKESDVIVMSATPIPGNEKAVANVISHMTEKRAKIIMQDTHVSGHACEEEIKLIYSLLRPKFVIPIHGDYRQRYAAKKIAEKIGVDEKNAIMLVDGDVLCLTTNRASVNGSVEHEKIMIDVLGAKDIDGKALADRQKLSNGGIVIISLAVNRENGEWMLNPVVTSFGLSRSDRSNKLFAEIREELKKQMIKHPNCKESEYKMFRNKMNRVIESFIHNKTGMDTIVFTTISEV